MKRRSRRTPPITRVAWISLWESLHTYVVHNVYKDAEFTKPFSQEECAQYVEHLPEIFYHAGTRIEKKEFLNSWECIVRHTSRLLENVRVDPPPNSELGLL